MHESEKLPNFLRIILMEASNLYRDKICVYDEHPMAGRDIQCRAPDSLSRYAILSCGGLDWCPGHGKDRGTLLYVKK